MKKETPKQIKCPIIVFDDALGCATLKDADEITEHYNYFDYTLESLLRAGIKPSNIHTSTATTSLEKQDEFNQLLDYAQTLTNDKNNLTTNE